MTAEFPKLTDGVIVLDRFAPDDAAAHLAGEDEEHARRFGWYPARSTREGVESTIRRWNSDWETLGPTRAFAARLGSSGVLVGGCEIRLAGEGEAEMSYWVFPPHRQKGYGTRIVELAATYTFMALDVQRLDLFIEPDNLASLAVARKAAFSKVGTTRKSIGADDEPVEVIHFGRRVLDGTSMTSASRE